MATLPFCLSLGNGWSRSAGSLAALHERDLTRRMEEIDRLMPLADTAEKDELTREKMETARELRRLGSRRFKGFSPQG